MQKNYTVKEVFFSIQGEGAHRGRHAVFCRFSGCNLWSGLEKDRASAICDFCDTDFVGINSDGGKFNSAGSVADAVLEKWPPEQPNKLVICTGGEPLLQLDANLLEEFHTRGFEVALETNGTLPAPPGIDWICVSPKMGTELVLKRGNELKLVYPQLNCEPGEFLQYEFDHFFLQPMDGPRQIQNTALAVEYCEQHQPWEISIQTQKLINVR